MGKIWLKSVDPNRQCCGCEGKSGPCQSCCSGILVNNSSISSDVFLKDCIFKTDEQVEIIKNNSSVSFSCENAELIKSNSTEFSFSVPANTIIDITFNKKIAVDNIPARLGIAYPSLSDYNILSEVYSVAGDSISIRELNNKAGAFELISSGVEKWEIISFSSSSGELSFTTPPYIHNNVIASGDYGIANPSSFANMTMPTRGFDEITEANQFARKNFPIPMQIAFKESSSSPLTCSDFDFLGSFNGIFNTIINPLDHPINKYLSFGSVEKTQEQKLYYYRFGPRMLFSGSTLEVVGDGLLRYFTEVNDEATKRLNELPNYAKFLFGHSRKMYPVDYVETYCSDERSFLDPISPSEQFRIVPTSTKFKIWFPTKWPLFSISENKTFTAKIKTKTNACIGVYLPNSRQEIVTNDGKNVIGTGWPPYSIPSSFEYQITGDINFNQEIKSSSKITYNNLYLYNGNTNNKIKCQP